MTRQPAPARTQSAVHEHPAATEGKPLRIGIPLRSYDRSFGGPGTYTEEIVHHLLEIDQTNNYVLILPRRDGLEAEAMPPLPQSDRCHVVQTRSRAGLLWDQLAVPLAARQWRLDVLFSPFQALPCWGGSARIMTVHGAERYAVPHILDWRNRLKWMVMERLMLPGADRVLAVSQTMARDFCAATGYPEAKVVTTCLGVDDTFAQVTDALALDEVRQRYQLDDRFILFVGHLFPNKNLGNLLRGFGSIASRLPHRLLIVGGRRWKYEDALALIGGLGLEGRVRSLGYVPRDDLIKLYNLADCFVFPSLYEFLRAGAA